MQCDRRRSYTQIIATALVLASSLPTAGQEAMAFAELKGIPCRTYVSTVGTEVYPRLIRAVLEFFAALPGAREAFGSSCNIPNYVRSECALHPGARVGDAVNAIAEATTSHKRLPAIPRCAE